MQIINYFLIISLVFIFEVNSAKRSQFLRPELGEKDENLLSSLERDMGKQENPLQPRHVHLSRRFGLDTMTVTWSTLEYADRQFVEWGSTPEILDKTVYSQSELLTSRGNGIIKQQFIHDATLRDLIAEQSYYYRCVSMHGVDNQTLYSQTYKFRVAKNGTDWSPNLLIFGDLGAENAVSLPYMQEEILTDTYDAAFHIGDIAYDMNWMGGETGDTFMSVVESVAATIPYQVCVGNHDVDQYKDYNEYSKRFRMPGNFDSLLYSWDLGPIHFVAISTEYYFYSKHLVEEQYEWLKNDLEEANKVRDTVPWIIVYGHTPMYCSNDNTDSCVYVDSPLRIGCPNDLCHGLEDLFYEQGVDLQIYGHEHSYETSYPLYNYKVYNGSAQEPYRNPPAPVHVITGSAGNMFEHDPYNETIPKPEWSRIRSIEYSYSRMRVENSSHLYWEQIAVPVDKKEIHLYDTYLLDSFTLIKDTHGPYSPVKSI